MFGRWKFSVLVGGRGVMDVVDRNTFAALVGSAAQVRVVPHHILPFLIDSLLYRIFALRLLFRLYLVLILFVNLSFRWSAPTVKISRFFGFLFDWWILLLGAFHTVEVTILRAVFFVWIRLSQGLRLFQGFRLLQGLRAPGIGLQGLIDLVRYLKHPFMNLVHVFCPVLCEVPSWRVTIAQLQPFDFVFSNLPVQVTRSLSDFPFNWDLDFLADVFEVISLDSFNLLVSVSLGPVRLLRTLILSGSFLLNRLRTDELDNFFSLFVLEADFFLLPFVFLVEFDFLEIVGFRGHDVVLQHLLVCLWTFFVRHVDRQLLLLEGLLHVA